jgi:hypothetical protein
MVASSPRFDHPRVAIAVEVLRRSTPAAAAVNLADPAPDSYCLAAHQTRHADDSQQTVVNVSDHRQSVRSIGIAALLTAGKSVDVSAVSEGLLVVGNQTPAS